MGLKPSRTLSDIFGRFIGSPVKVREKTTYVEYDGYRVPVVKPILDEDDPVVSEISHTAHDNGLRAIFNLPGDMHDLTQDTPGDVRVLIGKTGAEKTWKVEKVF